MTSTSSESSSAEASSEASSSAPATTAASVAPAGNDSGGNSLLWLWITLAAVVIIGIVVAIVAVRRNRRELAEQEHVQQEALLAAAAAAERNRQQQIPPDDSPTRVLGHGPYGPPPSPDGYGLLSGRDNDYPPMPPAVAEAPTEIDPASSRPGRQPTAGPTQAVGPDGPEQPLTGRHSIPDDHDQPAAPETGPLPAVPPGDDAGPSTEQWRPDFGDDADREK